MDLKVSKAIYKSIPTKQRKFGIKKHSVWTCGAISQRVESHAQKFGPPV